MGTFFINLDQAVGNNRLPILPFLPSGNPLVQSIHTIGVTAAIQDQQSTRYDIFVSLKQAGQPQPLPTPSVPPTAPPTPNLKGQNP
ncbi:DUF3352 domain-containing protein [Neosynechococcus sphagnicola]|uniref:DUF3352 domain-containing protein n=1 Tax=Neosynechococcus sphagnicola TaxID=1501145 RepID=UPI00068D8EA6|nr:DUF3352 domain-containing protein [Neosynechococcus sphagnicola]